MNTQQTLEVEAYAPAALIGAETFVPPARLQGDAQAIIQGFAIALLLAVTGLETFMCFTTQASGLF